MVELADRLKLRASGPMRRRAGSLPPAFGSNLSCRDPDGRWRYRRIERAADLLDRAALRLDP